MTSTYTHTSTYASIKWVRLELIDDIANHAKYYVICDGIDLAGFGRLGAKPQWSGVTGFESALRAKTRKGYAEVARGEVEIPNEWSERLLSSGSTTNSTRSALWDLIERQRSGSSSVFASQERPLLDLVESCQNLVSEAVANPDQAMHTYASIIGRVESAREDIETVESYIESLGFLLSNSEGS
jgi:hypothetical protein